MTKIFKKVIQVKKYTIHVTFTPCRYNLLHYGLENNYISDKEDHLESPSPPPYPPNHYRLTQTHRVSFS